MLFLARLLIRGYQIALSPVLHFLAGPGGGCRFEPTCSAYFLQALETHGVLRGTWLGVCRLGRCNPWGGRGEDPVPPKAHDLTFGRDAALRRPGPGLDMYPAHRTAQRAVPTVCE
ncbi:MAG: membrane protein insertion efficiency factor YidD [Chthoniobacterales bacterium]